MYCAKLLIAAILLWCKPVMMEYRKFEDTFYIRMDRGDEIIEEILKICKGEKIRSCVFSGIGGKRNENHRGSSDDRNERSGDCC